MNEKQNFCLLGKRYQNIQIIFYFRLSKFFDIYHGVLSNLLSLSTLLLVLLLVFDIDPLEISIINSSIIMP